MNKKFIVPIIIACAVIGFGGVYALTNRQDPPKPPTARQAEEPDKQQKDSGHSATTPAAITTDSSVAKQPADKIIELKEDRANPEEITIPVGQTLQFNARDGKTHRIALGQGGTEHEHTSQTDSGEFGADEGWRVRFDNPGTFYFHDHFNPRINVLVVAYRPSN